MKSDFTLPTTPVGSFMGRNLGDLTMGDVYVEAGEVTTGNKVPESRRQAVKNLAKKTVEDFIKKTSGMTATQAPGKKDGVLVEVTVTDLAVGANSTQCTAIGGLKELPKKERMSAHGNLKGKGDYTKKPNEGADVMIERCVTQAVDQMMTAASATIKAHGAPLVNTQLIYVETDVAYKGPAAYEATAVGAIQKLIDKQIADNKARFVTDSHPVGTPGYRIEMQVRAETKGRETTIKVKGDIYKLPDKLMVSVTAPTANAVVTGTVKAIHFADSGDGPVEEIFKAVLKTP